MFGRCVVNDSLRPSPFDVQTEFCVQVLVVDPPNGKIPKGAAKLGRDLGWKVKTTSSYRDAIESAQTHQIDAALVAGPSNPYADKSESADYERLLQYLESRRISAIVLDEQGASRNPRSLIDVVDPQISIAELQGRFAMIDRFHAHLAKLEGELARVERLSRDLTNRFAEVDQELRLASRLQRDFLPDLGEPIKNVQFESMYRPASWVSGDIFDVFQINDHCTGFYLADAVGHGMAASLLTMFIRRVLLASSPAGNNEELLEPSEALARINDALTNQDLPNCQFVTACYGVIDHRTLRLRIARGGHPHPILVAADGGVAELKSQGGLLGIFPGESYETLETQLHVGDRVLLYTDGAELALCEAGPDCAPATELCRVVQSLAHLPLRSMVRRLETTVQQHLKISPVQDDVSILGFEILD